MKVPYGLAVHGKDEEVAVLEVIRNHKTIMGIKTKQFETYVKNKLGKYCELHKSQDLIKKNYYGLFEPHSKLIERIGDYVMILKENYVIRDNILKQKRSFHIGNHGRVSDDEMFVPLIVFKT